MLQILFFSDNLNNVLLAVAASTIDIIQVKIKIDCVYVRMWTVSTLTN